MLSSSSEQLAPQLWSSSLPEQKETRLGVGARGAEVFWAISSGTIDVVGLS